MELHSNVRWHTGKSAQQPLSHATQIVPKDSRCGPFARLTWLLLSAYSLTTEKELLSNNRQILRYLFPGSWPGTGTMLGRV